MDSSAWDERYSGSDLVWSSEPNLWVEQVAAEMPAGRVLDLAGGEGRNALWLVDRGWTASIVDFSAVALQRAASLAAGRLGPDKAASLTTVCADLLTYEPPPQSFDLVLVVYLQVPAAERRTVLRSAANAVAVGGSMLVVAHDSANLIAGFGGPQDPAVLYTAEDAAADLADAGLLIERCETGLRPVATDAGTMQAIDALLLARRSDSQNTT